MTLKKKRCNILQAKRKNNLIVMPSLIMFSPGLYQQLVCCLNVPSGWLTEHSLTRGLALFMP